MARKEALQLDTLVIRSEYSIAVTTNNETVMLNPETGYYYGLDVVGSRIWDLLAQPTTVAAVAVALREQFDVDPQTCEQDVTELIEDLLNEQLAFRVGA